MLRFTSHGRNEMLIGSLVMLVLAAGFSLIHPLAALVVVPVWVWLLAFFRDPERPIPADENIMVSPADGTVSDVAMLENCIELGGPALRIGIFLSVFNVHVNRAPCDGKVLFINYKRGKFVNALNHNDASEKNESNTVVLIEPAGGRSIAVVKQIVGLIARRIICTLATGDEVKRGQRIGMIKFGSRTELYIPAWMEPTARVKVGQKVRGGLDIVATLARAPQTAAPARALEGVAA